jgi:hypothetical protein
VKKNKLTPVNPVLFKKLGQKVDFSTLDMSEKEIIEEFNTMLHFGHSFEKIVKTFKEMEE